MPHVRLPAFLEDEVHTLHDALTDSEELEKMHCAQVVAALKVTLAEEQRFLEREKRLRLWCNGWGRASSALAVHGVRVLRAHG